MKFQESCKFLTELYGREFSPDEAGEVLRELESFVAALKSELSDEAKPTGKLQRAAWKLQRPAARHQARLRLAVHYTLGVPLSQADEVLQAIQTVSARGAKPGPYPLDVARVLAGNPPADQPLKRPTARQALAVIRRLTRTEARRVVDEIDRRARLLRGNYPIAILSRALSPNEGEPYLNRDEEACVDVALRERAGLLSALARKYTDVFEFRRVLEDVSVDHARQCLGGNDGSNTNESVSLTDVERDILRRVAARDVQEEARYDEIRPEDAWRELAELARPDLADRFHEIDSAKDPLLVWSHGSDAASRQLAQAVARLPATAHVRGLRRAAGLARFAGADVARRLGLSNGSHADELLPAINHLSRADALSFLHDLAGYYSTKGWINASAVIAHEALLEGIDLRPYLAYVENSEIYRLLAHRAGIPEIDPGEPAYYQALRELPVQVARDLLRLGNVGILDASDAQTMQALHDAASPFPSLQQLALTAVSKRTAWQELAREVGRPDLIELDDREAHEEVLLRVILTPTDRREALARALGLEHLLYSRTLQQRAERMQRDVPPKVAAWRELTAHLGLPEYRLNHDDDNARRTVAAASLRLGTHTVDELVQAAGLSNLRDQAVRQQRAAFFERKQPAGAQRQHEGYSL